MRSRIKNGLWIAALSLTLAAPAHAYTGKANGGNGGLGNGMGTPSQGTGVRAHGVGGTTGHEISVYGTGTGSQFRNIHPGNPVTPHNRIDNVTRTPTDGSYRAAAANTARGPSWGWLGLLGLLGLVGIRNRNPQRDR